MYRFLSLFILFVTFSGCLAAREDDRVTFLPRLDGPQPTFRHYAGYLKASEKKNFFYWFVESESDPANDPVVLWLNGGPGCSSMTGKLIELGPWRVNKEGRLSWFEQRWNKKANIIFMESPSCVGFSYDDDDNCATSDDETAQNNYNAMKDFFVGWPELVDNILYITGESYAGVYVPTVSVLLANDSSLNFQGMAIGNPVSNRRMMTNSLTYFAYSRGIIGVEMWNDLLDACCVNRNASDCNFYRSEDANCFSLSAEVNRLVWRNGLNPYNLYDKCDGGVPNYDGFIKKDGNTIEVAPIDMLPPDLDIEKYQKDIREYIEEGYEVRSRIPCSDSRGRETFLNDAEVRRALHVKDGLPQWQPCSAIVSSQYIRQYLDLKPQHLEILQKGYRILKFSGDLDMACNHWGDLWFSEDLGLEVVEPYRPWHYTHKEDNTKQIAGFSKHYRNLTYATVKGAGHFVPTDKPDPSYEMWDKFLRNQPL